MVIPPGLEVTDAVAGGTQAAAIHVEDWVGIAVNNSVLTIRADNITAPAGGSAQTLSFALTLFIPQFGNSEEGIPALRADDNRLSDSALVEFVNISAGIRTVIGNVNDTVVIYEADATRNVAWQSIDAYAGTVVAGPAVPGVRFTNTFSFEFSGYLNYSDVLVSITMTSGTVIDPDTYELRVQCGNSNPVMPPTSVNFTSPHMTLSPTPEVDPAGGFRVLN